MSEKVGEAGDAASKPTALLVMGMAGSGKTTFVQRLTAELQLANLERPPYVLNLDPAVADLRYPVRSLTLNVILNSFHRPI
jgi:GTPase SAR1 family protein